MTKQNVEERRVSLEQTGKHLLPSITPSDFRNTTQLCFSETFVHVYQKTAECEQFLLLNCKKKPEIRKLSGKLEQTVGDFDSRF